MPYFTAPLRPQQSYYPQYDSSSFLNPFLAALLADQLPSTPSTERTPSPSRRSNTTTTDSRANKKPKTTMSGAAAASKPNPTPRQPHRNLRAFTPNFDVYESDSCYTLEGNLPGLADKKAIDIEFSDDRTLMIRGKVERTIPVDRSAAGKRSLKATVEDTDDEDDYSVISTSDKEGKDKKAGEEKREEKEKVVGEMKTWLSERTFGSFQRSFEFPTPVKVEEVKASLEAGVLRIVVPKVGLKGVRKIEID